nr:MAG TPA: hypothetical protein [Caudoviricetes sp.]
MRAVSPLQLVNNYIEIYWTISSIVSNSKELGVLINRTLLRYIHHG